jgi:hypothetical protein
MKIEAQNNFVYVSKVKREEKAGGLYLPQLNTAVIEVEVIDSPLDKYKQGDKLVIERCLYEYLDNFFVADEHILGRLKKE